MFLVFVSCLEWSEFTCIELLSDKLKTICTTCKISVVTLQGIPPHTYGKKLCNIVKVSSANVQGIRDKLKRVDILTYLLRDVNILCLQDTHLISSDIKSLMLHFPEYKIIVNGNKTNSRGVAIFLKNNFEFKIISTENDNNGNLIVCDLQIGEVTLRLLNVYAPNIDNPAFFQTIKHYIDDSPQMYTLLCGDLNLILDHKMDSSNYRNLNNPRSRDILL